MHNTIDYVAKTADSGKENCLSCALANERYGIGMMPPKKLLFYANGSNGAGKRLQKVVEELVPKDRLEICRTIESFSGRLCRPGCRDAIAVLLAASAKELVDFLFIRDLLSDVRIILIVPDRDDATISRGHKLYPRFLSYMDTDFNDVASVLGKMLTLHNYISPQRH